ncbi:MAG: RtcB family protein [Lentisphaerae bacterium]|nr:RtcB family protein [Lentisphaerota bacterium]
MYWENTDNRIPILSWCGEVDGPSLIQAVNLANHSETFHHVALMPDCHVGYGMPIGGVIACERAVIPNAVGVDIGCGVAAIETDFPAERADRAGLAELLGDIRRTVPVGFQHHRARQQWDGWDSAPMRSPPVAREADAAGRQLGTLGGGNHFIEVQASDAGRIWLMVHSGSRNFGLKIAEHYHECARKWCASHRAELPSHDLAFLPLDTDLAAEYIEAMEFALAFARRNRELIIERVASAFFERFGGSAARRLNVHHNYCRRERHFGREVVVHRKGATSARAGETGVIPGSMGTSSYIVRGLGNPASFESSSHGAGRCMGRNEANRRLNTAECDRAMEGVVFGRWGRDRRGKPDLSEAPQAYKNIEDVMSAQTDLVAREVRLQPLAVVKG